ncbi:immunoglobulin-like domain-containing protein [uncultured Dubosiella sp.]|uniref:immunoglobulin-like domain-containing protein n=1 Tax=uncultured Dubosiella sp. TaxID=1937011 RepID=UPI0026038E75|nr:immunoglobulin-like domain-containing protein [uncultured Dubosiella sp.]
MELTEKEKELLNLYRLHKKKKRKRFLLGFFLILSLSGSLYTGYKYIYEPSKKSVAKMEEQIEKIDRTAPVLELSRESIEIKEGDTIDYMAYVSHAEDDRDGNLHDKVKYSTIDTSKSGEYLVTYVVTDKAGNKTTASLQVTVGNKASDKPKEETEKEEKKETSIEEKKEELAEVQQTPAEEPVYEEPSQSVLTVPSTPQPVVPSTPAPAAPQKPENKQFLFSEGYNMENVSGACMAYITGYTGGCYPLQDANGIYYGMEARFE